MIITECDVFLNQSEQKPLYMITWVVKPSPKINAIFLISVMINFL